MYERIRKLDELRLLERHPPVWFKGPKLVRVTRVGAEMADMGLRPAPIAPNSIIMRHSLAVVDLTEDLLGEYADAELVTERELRRDHRRGEGRTDRQGRVSRFPDAVLKFPDGRAISLELDLSRKGPVRTREKVQAFLWQQGVKVWWYCAAPDIFREVRRAVEQEKADDVIEVRTWRH
jgi:hypothetical protein